MSAVHDIPDHAQIFCTGIEDIPKIFGIDTPNCNNRNIACNLYCLLFSTATRAIFVYETEGFVIIRYNPKFHIFTLNPQ